ncbi:MAG: hypothetical protein ACRCZS_12815 [Chroococcidiopsis sp.]
MVGSLERLTVTAETETATKKSVVAVPLKFDPQLLDLTYEESQKHWRFSEILGLRANAGVMSALYAPGTDWGKVIEFVERLRDVFSLPPETVFASVWRDASSGDTRRVLPSVKLQDGKPVVAMPKALDPLTVDKYSVVGGNVNVEGLIIPFSLDIAGIRDAFDCVDDDDMFKDVALPTVQDMLKEGDFNFVRPFIPAFLRFDPSLEEVRKETFVNSVVNAKQNQVYVATIARIFNLDEDAVIHSTWENKDKQLVNNLPAIKRHEGALVLALPNAKQPIPLSVGYRIKGDVLVFDETIEIPVSLDWELLPDAESRRLAKEDLGKGKFNFVKEWKAPGGNFAKLRDLEPGIYFANSVAIELFEGTKKADGKKFKTKQAKIMMRSLDDTSFTNVTGTENNGASLLRELRGLSTSPDFYEFYETGDIIAEKEMSFRKAFILLYLSKHEDSRGTTVSLAALNPISLKSGASPVMMKFLESHGHTPESLYQEWAKSYVSEATTETEEVTPDTPDVVQPSLAPVPQLDIDQLMQRSDALIKEKQLDKKALIAYCRETFGVKTRQEMTAEQLISFCDWLESKETPQF